MRRVLPWAAAAASGASMALALPLVVPSLSIAEVDPAGWLEALAWVALVPALLSLRAAPSGRAALGRGLLAGIAYAYVAMYWVAHAMAIAGVAPPLAFLALTVLVLGVATFWAAAFAVSWKIRASLGWPLHLHLPLVWAAAELARNHLLISGFPWGNLGYTQARTPRIAQLAALLGVYAVAALVVLVNATLAEAIAARLERRAVPVRALAATLAVGAAVLGHGEWRVRSLRARVVGARSLKVAVVQPNVDQRAKNEGAARQQWVLSRLVPPTVEADRAGADLVVWPETAFPKYVPPRTLSFAGDDMGLPALGRAHLLLGALDVEFIHGRGNGERLPRVRNVALLLSPALDVRDSVLKHRLVPFGEYVPMQWALPFVTPLANPIAPMKAGRDPRVLELVPTTRSAAALPGTGAQGAWTTDAGAGNREPVRLAPLICYDALFPEISGALGRQDPDVLVLLTNDAWYGYSSGPYQSLDVARMRAVETGKALVRAAYAGVSAVILPTGEVAPGALEVGPVDASHPLADDPGPRLLVAEVPLLGGRTPYTRLGDAFAWACAAVTAASLALGLARGRARRAVRP